MRRLSLLVFVAAVLAGCGSATVAPRVRPAADEVTAASCAGLDRAQQFAAATVVFEGTMLAGPVVPATHGVLSSPARVKVSRYLKGHGSRIVTVQTAVQHGAGGGVISAEDGIEPRAGERWEILASSRRQPYATSICLGSHRLSPVTRHFASSELSFDYPASWHARAYQEESNFSRWIVWLSPQPMHHPCTTSRSRHVIEITCTDPVARLKPDSILASWTEQGWPGWSFRRQPGRPLTVGGRPAKWEVQRGDGGDRQLDATELVTVIVTRSSATDNWYQLTAFIRGPHTDGLVSQLRALLRTVRWNRASG